MTPDLKGATWRKSSRSNNTGGQCVELARTATMAAVRDSKDPDGGALIFNQVGLNGFLAWLKAGLLDR